MRDVTIIGGGICGCSLLFELCRYDLDVLLVEKENDVGVGTTKANSAIVHAGYDPAPGTLMARYNVLGNPLVEQLCADLDVLYRKTGSLVVGFDETDRGAVQKLYNRGLHNGVPGMRILEKRELHQLEPALHPSASCALYAPSAGVVNPWELASAQAEVAIENGGEVWLDTEVVALRREAGRFVVETTAGPIETRFVVNAAGVYSARISDMVDPGQFSIQPSRGEYFLLDTTQGDLLGHIVFQCPSEQGKGVLAAPTVHGNLIVGPNAEPVAGENLATTAEGLHFVRESALRSVPGINFRESIRNFAGVRAVADTGDFIVGESKTVPGFFNMAGIKSPGLTSAPAIAKDVAFMLETAGLVLQGNPGFNGTRKIRRFNHMSGEEQAAIVKENPLYGQIVCRCETVTEGELVEAMHRPLPPRTLDAVKRRCTPGKGRCQGGFCGPRVLAIISRELGIPPEKVALDKHGSYIVTGQTKTGAGCLGGAENTMAEDFPLPAHSGLPPCENEAVPSASVLPATNREGGGKA